MGQFLIQVSYTSQAMAALVVNPQDRRAAVKSVIEKLGGTLDDAWHNVANTAP